MTPYRFVPLLREIGLSANEIAVYELLFSNGKRSASEINKKTQLTRTNTYNVLKQLESKGLIRRSKPSTVTLFHAEHPEAIKAYIQRQQHSIVQSQQHLEQLMPDMTALYAMAENTPGVFRFEGKAGMITAYEELLKDKLPICSIQNRAVMRAFIPEYNPHFVATRLQLKIPHRLISPANIDTQKEDTGELREVRYIDAETFPFRMDLKITKKKVLMTTFKNETAVGIVIIDPEIVYNYQVLFDFLWETVPLIYPRLNQKRKK